MSDDSSTVQEPAADAPLTEADWNQAYARAKGAPAEPAKQPEPPKATEKADPEPDPEQEPEPESSNRGSDPDPDPWAGATEEQRTQYQTLEKRYRELEHRYKSDEGRVGALQRKIDELQAAQKEPPKPADMPGEFKQFASDYPDEAKAITAWMREQGEAAKAEIAKLREQVESLSGSQSDRFSELMDLQRPDWRETVQAVPFRQWLVAQSEETQALYSSPRPADAMKLLRAWDAHQEKQRNKADQIKADRSTRLAESESVRGGRSASTPDEMADEDPDALWDAAYDKVRKQFHLRR